MNSEPPEPPRQPNLSSHPMMSPMPSIRVTAHLNLAPFPPRPSKMVPPPSMPASRFPSVREWKAIVEKYQHPSVWRATWQLVNTLVPYVALWFLMYHFMSVSWWIVAPLAMLAGALLARVFIIFHDCGHGSFFRSRRANDITGFITGLLTFTPYYHWRWEHSIHHASTGDLDRRGAGDLWTMTVQEYLESSRWRRFAYKLARNPIVLFILAPLYVFIIHQRFPKRRADARERRSVWQMNLALLAMALALSWVFGPVPYLIIQSIVIGVVGTAGLWMFYIQHQFEDAYWEHHEDWDYTAAALQGSSFYKLPRILQWFTGNIGYHHIHHLSSRIPNYNLERCHDSHPVFQQVKPITIRISLKSLAYRLWDEQRNKLVGYRRMREVRREQAVEKAAQGQRSGRPKLRERGRSRQPAGLNFNGTTWRHVHYFARISSLIRMFRNCTNEAPHSPSFLSACSCRASGPWGGTPGNCASSMIRWSLSVTVTRSPRITIWNVFHSPIGLSAFTFGVTPA
jgi:omega-6 fatty acid desaturase (delta-12 desaturase)